MGAIKEALGKPLEIPVAIVGMPASRIPHTKQGEYALLSFLLEAVGFETIDLGLNENVTSYIHAIRNNNAALVYLCSGYMDYWDRVDASKGVKDVRTAIGKASLESEPLVLVGGNYVDGV